MEQTQLLLGVFLSVTLCSIGANARVFSNCSLAQELVNTHNISRATVGEWVCLAFWESKLNTAAIEVHRIIVPRDAADDDDSNSNSNSFEDPLGRNSNSNSNSNSFEDSVGSNSNSNSNSNSFEDSAVGSNSNSNSNSNSFEDDKHRGRRNNRSSSNSGSGSSSNSRSGSSSNSGSGSSSGEGRPSGGRTFNVTDYGLFGINDRLLCQPNPSTRLNLNICRVNCTSLIDDNIADDVACIKKVIGSTRAGFAVFPSWMQKCRAGSRRNGNADWVAGCF